MRVALERILSKGNLDEALVINILQDGSLKNLCVYDQTKYPEDTEMEVLNLIWMFYEDILIKESDKVLLYSGSDQGIVHDDDTGVNVYRFYMNRDQPIWAHANDSAFLFDFADFSNIEEQQREFLR